jgi:hypothetical protein
MQLANHGNVQIIPEFEYNADVEDEDERFRSVPLAYERALWWARPLT